MSSPCLVFIRFGWKVSEAAFFLTVLSLLLINLIFNGFRFFPSHFDISADLQNWQIAEKTHNFFPDPL